MDGAHYCVASTRTLGQEFESSMLHGRVDTPIYCDTINYAPEL